MQYPFQLDSTLSVLLQADVQFIISTDIFGTLNFCNNKAGNQLALASKAEKADSKLIALLSDSDKINYRKTIQLCLEDISQSQTINFQRIGNLNFKFGVQFIISCITNDAAEVIGFY